MRKSLLGAAAVLAVLLPNAYAACPPKSTPALLEKGKAAFTTNCQICHGEKGDGNGAVPMNPKPRNFISDKFKNGDTVPKVMETVSKGLAGTAMASFGHLPEDDRCALAHYVLAFRKK